MRLFLLSLPLLAGACHGGTLRAKEALAQRTACTFGRGAQTADTLGHGAPGGSQIPIDTFVVVMMENRSFDHLFGDVAGLDGADGAAADAANPDRDGQAIVRFHQDAYCFADTNHEWDASHEAFDDGRMDGFVHVNDGEDRGRRAMGFYTAADVPFIYALAREFAVGDRYFSSVLGPTDPNRAYLYAGSSFGLFESGVIEDEVTTIFDALDAKGIAWAEYHEALPPSGVFTQSFLRHLGKGNYPPLDQFFSDATQGSLPSVVFIDATYQGGATREDGHPPGDIQIADAFLAKIFRALSASPEWPHAALLITFDEGGGLYDHVPPPKACAPDDVPPRMPTPYRFDRLGFRVPLVVASPYAHRRFVSHTVFDHTSILRLIEARFQIGALGRRDANADAMLDLFDLGHPDSSVPALEAPSLDQDKLKACMARFPS